MSIISHERLVDYLAANQYRYYYDSLSKYLQTAYNEMLDGYMNHKDGIVVKVSSLDEVWSVHKALCYDIPELFFIKSVKSSFDSSSSKATLYPEYRFDYATCLNIIRQMEKRTATFVQNISSMSEWEKVKQIHDFIVRNVTYKDVEAPYSHESPGAIIYGISVCEGISKAFKYLADRVCVNSIVIIGKAVDSINQQNGANGHAWNIVYINNIPYHIDVTFDYSLSSETVIRYDYYLLSDRQIKNDHSYDKSVKCANNYEFYLLEKRYAYNRTTLQKLVRNHLKHENILVVKIPDFSYNSEEIAEMVFDTVCETVLLSFDLCSTIKMSYNCSRMIFQFELCK